MAVCGGSSVVLAQLNELAIEVNGDIVLDRKLTDGRNRGCRFVLSPSAAAFD